MYKYNKMWQGSDWSLTRLEVSGVGPVRLPPEPLEFNHDLSLGVDVDVYKGKTR